MPVRWFFSLRGKIIVSLVLLIIVPVLFILYRFYSSTQGILESQLYQSNQTAVERKAASMNELFSSVLKASNWILNDMEISKFLRDSADWTKDYSSYYNYTLLLNKLSNIGQILPGGNAYVALYDFRGYMHSTWAHTAKTDYAALREEPWFARTIQLQGSPNWMVPIPSPDAPNEPLLVMTRLLNAYRQNGDGTMWIGVPIGSFFYSDAELEQQARGGTHLVLMDHDRPLLGDTDMLPDAASALANLRVDGDGIGHAKIGKEEYMVNSASLPVTGWSLVQLVNQREFASRLNQERNKSTLFVLLWFSLFAIAFVGLTFQFTRPIKRLVKSMNLVGKGELQTEVAVSGRDEMAMLGRNFNKMTKRLQELVAHLSAEQQRKQKAQFQALQAQINPHFLLNTMNSIKWMAILSGAEHISEMVTKLGKLLNYTMRQQEEIVPLRDELEYLQVYLALQKIRYHDDIAVTTDIPEELLDAEIVKFTLQPIVENSIIHGNRFPLHISIRARINGKSMLRLEIQDNGVGMDSEKIRDVESRTDEPHAKFSGIGIRNVVDRIRLEFGPGSGAAIRSEPGGGVLVTVTLPYRRKVNEDAPLADRG
ncbi:cache domain-containing sensor histidine kinase [Cohnella zeiphila]|uniref:Sensor histidine kinase n=1 Tax=Cohnella zeiphila TaxID=2761120 RepID=A0A7X0SJ52_9BACL|nr:sensor histidine kinase [Cohnella zeiphila]MBB6730936.1 sensor histidine kinase [Cohnella zeiphila]